MSRPGFLLQAVVLATCACVALAWLCAWLLARPLAWVDGLLVINLPDRPDRLRQFRRDLEAAGVSASRLARVAARHSVQAPDRARLAAHITALTHAWGAGWRHVLVCEDDYSLRATPAWTRRYFANLASSIHSRRPSPSGPCKYLSSNGSAR